MLKISFILSVILAITACNRTNILISDELKTSSTVMPVKGRQGLQINQVVRFGDYYTSKIKRGWTKGYDINFVIRFQKASEKLSFTQLTPDHKQAEVLAVGKFKSTELDFLQGFLSYPIKYENIFAGSIITSDSVQNVWEFIIHNPEGDFSGNEECGMVKDSYGNEIKIMGVKKIEGAKTLIQAENFGFEFIFRGESIGAVSVINNGKVWLKNDLCPDFKLILSCISTSLLVRHSMEESISSARNHKIKSDFCTPLTGIDPCLI